MRKEGCRGSGVERGGGRNVRLGKVGCQETGVGSRTSEGNPEGRGEGRGIGVRRVGGRGNSIGRGW
jgi:hypothetical protein